MWLDEEGKMDLSASTAKKQKKRGGPRLGRFRRVRRVKYERCENEGEARGPYQNYTV